MSFAERFNGRTSFMNKDGVVGIVAQKSLPIDKTPGTSQMNYFTPSNNFAGPSDDRARVTNSQTRSEFQGNNYPKFQAMTPQHNLAYHSSMNEMVSEFSYPQRNLMRPEQNLVTKSPPQRSKSSQNGEENYQPINQAIAYSKPPMPKRSTGDQPQNQYYNGKNKKIEVIPKQVVDGSQYQSLQLPQRVMQQPYVDKPTSRNYIVQQHILSNGNHVDFGMKYQHNNINAERYKQYQFYNGPQNEMTNRNPQGEQFYQVMDMQLEQRQQQLPEYFPREVMSEGHLYQQPTQRPQFYQMQGMDPYAGMQGPYNGDTIQTNMLEPYSADQMYNNGDMSTNPKSTNKSFKPYTLKDYKALKSQGASRRGGLGPNTYSEDWVKKKEKTNKMAVYAELVRISNTKSAQLRKPQTEENKVKPSRLHSNPLREYPNNYNYETYDVENEGYMMGNQLGRQERQQLQFLNRVDQL